MVGSVKRRCCTEAVDAWAELSRMGRREVADKNRVTEKGASGFAASLDKVLQIEEARAPLAVFSSTDWLGNDSII